VQNKEDTVAVVPDFSQCSGADDQEGSDCAKPKDDVAVLYAFEQERVEDVEVQVHGGMGEEECDEDTAE